MRAPQTISSALIAVAVLASLLGLLIFGPTGRDVATPKGTVASTTPTTADPGRAPIPAKYPKCRNVEPAENSVTCRGVLRTFTISRGSTLLVNSVGIQIRFARLSRSEAGKTEVSLSGYVGTADADLEPEMVRERIYLAAGSFKRYPVSDFRLTPIRQGSRGFTLTFEVPTRLLAKLTRERGRARLTFNIGAFGEGRTAYIGVLSIRLPRLLPGSTSERLY